MPDISVVIPVYNKEKYIVETIQSVLEQTLDNFELILVDDGSTDTSLQKMQSFDDDRINIVQQPNQGVAIARNTGVRRAKSGLIAFLDADDTWLPNHLDEIMLLYKEFKAAAFYATAYRVQFKNHQYEVVHSFDKKRLQLKPYYRYDKGHALFYTSNFAIKKDVFLKEKGFTSGIDAEDTQFFIRIGQKYPLAYSRTVTMNHLNEADNSLFNRYQLEKKIALLDFFKKDELNDSYLKTYLDLHRFTWAVEALINHNDLMAKQLIKEIDVNNLNWKQKLLLRLPAFLLRLLKNIQRKMKGSGIFWSAFSK